MDRHMSEALDRHITGNYGEDQFREEYLGRWPAEDKCQVSDCTEPAEDGVLCTVHLAEQEAAT
jgi:hypothetical protein